MEVNGSIGKDLSDQSKAAPQSETWKEAKRVMKTDITHFTDTQKIIDFNAVKESDQDNIYGIEWGKLVYDYLKRAYPGEGEDVQVVSCGHTYKVLNRGEVTSFYDADGNTLFDVVNERLKKEYEWLTEEKVRGAAEKLEKELKEAKDRSFAEPVIGYLLKRCKDDEGLAEDVMQEHKTWQKCFDYIYSQAKKQTNERCAAVRDETVYEWAEDYYHKDDKAEEEEKARKAVRKDKQKKAVTGKPTKAKKKPDKMVPVPEKKESAPKEQHTPKKSNKDMEGQLDMFSMMGM